WDCHIDSLLRMLSLRSQISDLRSQISDLKSQITNLRSQISDHKSQISNLRSQISDHKSQISNLRTQISDHKSQITSHPKSQIYNAEVTAPIHFHPSLPSIPFENLQVQCHLQNAALFEPKGLAAA